jgi:hypothetical protein
MSDRASSDFTNSWKDLLIGAYARFHEHVELARSDFPGLVGYEIGDVVAAASGNAAWKFGIPEKIREITNITNAWGMRLHEWGIWQRVLDGYSNADERWEIQYHFVEPIAHFCLFQPSGFADRLVEVAEDALHQANLRVIPGYRDVLDQDSRDPPGRLNRRQQLKQLELLGCRWTAFPAFLQHYREVNSDYRQRTRNFRNLAAHSFAPRFELGIIGTATRSIANARELVPQGDGSFVSSEVPGRKCVQYDFGLLQPFSLSQARSDNLAEYKHTLTTMSAFAQLIEELCHSMNNTRAVAPRTVPAHEP